MTIELTNKELEKLAKSLRGDGWLCRSGSYDPETRLVDTVDGDAVANAFDELLALRSRDAGDDLHQHLREKDAEIERLRVQLSGCLTAAEGHFPDPPVCKGDYAWTPAYQKTLNLRRERDTLNAEVERLKGYIAVLNGGGPPNE